MSTELDNIFVPLAYDLINEFGTSMTLTETARGSTNRTSGVVATGSGTDYSIKGVIEEYRADLVAASQQQSNDEKTVRFGDRKVLIYAQDLPTTLDVDTKLYTLTISSVVWNIIRVKPVFSGDDISYYELQVRK